MSSKKRGMSVRTFVKEMGKGTPLGQKKRNNMPRPCPGGDVVDCDFVFTRMDKPRMYSHLLDLMNNDKDPDAACAHYKKLTSMTASQLKAAGMTVKWFKDKTTNEKFTLVDFMGQIRRAFDCQKKSKRQSKSRRSLRKKESV